MAFNISDQYAPQYLLGRGAYGIVHSALHKPTGRRVAIKKITSLDDALICKRTLREIKLLRHFDHKNIISILQIQRPPDYELFSEVYLIQELMDYDMNEVIRTQEISDQLCKYFVYQILCGLKALHSANVIHRDLKPSNLLVNVDCHLRICDFGLARSTVQENGAAFTEYVVTRWYRAPEIMLSPRNYTKAIDMWSVGCIFGEMLHGRPLFPGKNYNHQLILILDFVGTPDRAHKYILSLPFKTKALLREKFPLSSDSACDLLDKLLQFSPDKRITVEEALQHLYLSVYHDPADEPTADPVQDTVLDFEHVQDGEELKQLLYAEVKRCEG